VDPIELDAVTVESAQAALKGPPRRAPVESPGVGHELGGDDRRPALVPIELAKQPLRAAPTINLGGVEEGDAAVDGGPERGLVIGVAIVTAVAPDQAVAPLPRSGAERQNRRDRGTQAYSLRRHERTLPSSTFVIVTGASATETHQHMAGKVP
jgi:hypothetical protein